MRPESLDFLTRLLNTPTPSGEEHRGQRVWLDYVKPFAHGVETDTYGNAIATLNPKGSPKIMVEGHADEIAFQIQYIDDDGFIYFSGVGGHDPALARGQRVHIHGRNGPVLGVIGALAIHMQDRGKKAEIPELHELFIDIGAPSRKEAGERVAVGDLITYIVGWQQLNGDIYIARACDNRIGTFVAAETLRLCAKAGKKLKASVVAASAVGEENGLYGAHMIGYSVRPDAALVVDVGQATDIPVANRKRFGDTRLGQGPILSRGSVNHPVLIKRLEDVARKNKIAFQRGIDPRYSGTDADAIFLQRGGIATAAIGVPNRYMHTPVEAVHLQDLENLAEWLTAFILDLRPGETFKVKI
ncbi:MAG: M20/M25/M40 family metallo-hydrolase [Methylacidiphilales bacterium]|nr:M20/M25/M40 family metallo-hydrolase [Candidatus Methylacidiphilales bacterium]